MLEVMKWAGETLRSKDEGIKGDLLKVRTVKQERNGILSNAFSGFVTWLTLHVSSVSEMLSDFRRRWGLNPESALRVSRGKQTLTLRFNGSIQSQMLLSKPYSLVLSYTRTMTGFLLFQPMPRHIAMIGLGGGSLTKWCHEYLPNSQLSVIEISQQVIELRSTFQVPPDDERLKVILGDGAEYVRQSTDRPDVLLVDGYDLDGVPSRQTCTQAFYDDCFRVLADDGVLVVNLDSTRMGWIGRIRQSFANRVTVVTPSDGQNKIVFALKGRTRPAENDTLEALTHKFRDEFSKLAVHISRSPQ
jgi:spermidine synthase